jgi:hypothetical protein
LSTVYVSIANLKSKVVPDLVLEFTAVIATGVSPDGIGKPWVSLASSGPVGDQARIAPKAAGNG